MRDFKVIGYFIGLCLVLAIGFNNCGRSAEFNTGSSTVNGDNSVLSANSLAAENLLELLNDAKETEARLRDQGSNEALAQADEIRKYIDIIEEMISSTGGGLAVDDNRVLDFRDYLINSHLMGRDMLIEYNFAQAIAELKEEDVRLRGLIDQIKTDFAISIENLRLQVEAGDANLQAQIDRINTNFENFQSIVENRFINIEGRLVNVENIVAELQQQIVAINVKIENLNNQINDLENTVDENHHYTAIAIFNIKQVMIDIKIEIQNQIIIVQTQDNDLRKKFLEHQEAYNNLIKKQNTLALIQGSVCKEEIDGSIAANQTQCDPSSPDTTEDMVTSGQCCMRVTNLDCDMIFSGDDAESELVRNQCNAFVVNVMNRDEQIKELAQIQKDQEEAIDNLSKTVAQNQTDISLLKVAFLSLWSNIQHLNIKIGKIYHHLKSMDGRILVLEFKAARSEAISALNEMSDLQLAWITRRKMDVKSRFCHSNASSAYKRSDYQVARQNYDYCQERLKWLNEAKELVHLSKSYISGLGSLNLDQSCSATISGVQAESISLSQIGDDVSVSRQIIERCQSGPALVKSLLVSIVRLQQRISPDFRTAEYLAKKSKIVQLLYFGTEVARAGSTKIMAFENIDPSSSDLADTYYGRIERPFVKRYIETRLRVNGKFPTDPSQFPGSVAGFNRVYSHKTIASAGNDYLARVKKLELKEDCPECDFIVVGRNSTKPGSNRYSYPQDAQTQCPIYNEQVIVRSSDGKHYAYRMNYTRRHGASETLAPYWFWRNHHYAIAESDADVANGQFRRCGYRVRHIVHRFGMPDTLLRGRLALRSGTPYAKTHGLPQCRRMHFTCRLWEGGNGQGEWTAPSPNANIMHYLNGMNASSSGKLQNHCSESGAGYIVNEREMSTDEKKIVYYYKSQQDSRSLTYANYVNASTTQLSDKYWMVKDQAISYGYGNDKVSKSKPFYGTSSSHGNSFFRALYPLTDFDSIKVQQCRDPGV